nr:hypothetical protein [Halopelagius longus]
MRVLVVVDANGERLATVNADLGEIVVHRRVTVRAMTDVLTVDVHVEVSVDSAESDGCVPVYVVRESTAVPAHTTGSEALLSPAGILGIERTANAPVVGDFDDFPAAIVELRVGTVVEVATVEAPVCL